MTSGEDAAAKIVRKAADGGLKVAVVGLGYVGLPLALAFAARGVNVLGLDIDPAKPKRLLAGESYLTTAPATAVQAANASGCFDASTDMALSLIHI